MSDPRANPGPVANDDQEELVAEVIDRYLDLVEQGQNPSVDSFASEYPQISDLLHEMLPAMRAVQMETVTHHPNKPPQSDSLDGAVEGQLGDFHIVREIGRGGMGVVYEAEQISLRRRVALKVLPFAAALDPKRLERFQNEAQAAARLHHANIVPVYSVGCERGVYYYAMQIIVGNSLADVIRALRSMKKQKSGDALSEADARALALLSRTRAGTRALSSELQAPLVMTESEITGEPDSTEAPSAPDTVGISTHTQLGITTDADSLASPTFIQTAVDLGIQAAEGLDHAHSFDVVHRDVKPANLLVDPRGQLWITDFGLARIRTEASVTVSGDFVGTFLYSSPEQVLGHAGGVDARSDIYSLGATLYELLTQEPVVQSIRREKILHEIANSDPIAPRRHNSAIPADLETILLKSLAKEPALRYQTAREFADDLRRFRDDRPILARRPTLIQRGNRWLKRHTSVIVSSVLVLVVAVVALAVSTILIARAQEAVNNAYYELADEQNATSQALASEELQRRLAERNFQHARDMLDVFMEIAEKELGDRPELQELRAQLLQVSLEYYQDFIGQKTGDAVLQSELAEAHMGIARILHQIGSTRPALDAVEQALQVQEELVRRNPHHKATRMRLFLMYQQLGMFRGRNGLWLASLPPVQKELGMSDEQVATVRDLLEKHRTQFQQIRKWTDFVSMRKQFQQQTEEIEGTLRARLTERQVNRLRQITVQRQGTEALLEPKVAKQLALTSTQISEIERIQEESRAFMEQWKAEGRNESVREPLQAFDDRIIAVLTTEQTDAWSIMKGAPFTSWYSRAKDDPEAKSSGESESSE